MWSAVRTTRAGRWPSRSASGGAGHEAAGGPP
jgi:hypothetical protein